MCVAHLDGAQQHLINGSYGDLSREEALGMLGRPASQACAGIRLVVPPEAELWQPVAACTVGHLLSGHREHHGRAIGAKDAVANRTTR